MIIDVRNCDKNVELSQREGENENDEECRRELNTEKEERNRGKNKTGLIGKKRIKKN